MTIILDGKKLSEKILEELKLKTKSKNIGLATILVGEDYASNLYVTKKGEACKSVGIPFKLLKYDENITEQEIINAIKSLNEDKAISGILVQLPLPKKINTRKVLDLISPEKDVDCLTSVNLGKILANEENYLPATPKGIIRLLEEYKINVEGKKVCIVGESVIVGRPLAASLLNRRATVEITSIHTRNLKEHTLKADIVISATGVPHLIKKDMIKENAIIIDVGTSKKDGKLTGDVDYENVKDKSSYITPVPGGVGPMTVAMLIENVCKLK